MRVLVPPGTHSSHPTCKPVHDLFQRHVGQHSNKQERLLKETRGLGGELPDGTMECWGTWWVLPWKRVLSMEAA